MFKAKKTAFLGSRLYSNDWYLKSEICEYKWAAIKAISSLTISVSIFNVSSFFAKDESSLKRIPNADLWGSSLER